MPVIGADMYIYRCHHTAFTDHGRLESIENQSFESAWMKLSKVMLSPCLIPQNHVDISVIYDQRNKEILDAMKGCPTALLL